MLYITHGVQCMKMIYQTFVCALPDLIYPHKTNMPKNLAKWRIFLPYATKSVARVLFAKLIPVIGHFAGAPAELFPGRVKVTVPSLSNSPYFEASNICMESQTK